MNGFGIQALIKNHETNSTAYQRYADEPYGGFVRAVGPPPHTALCESAYVMCISETARAAFLSRAAPQGACRPM